MTPGPGQILAPVGLCCPLKIVKFLFMVWFLWNLWWNIFICLSMIIGITIQKWRSPFCPSSSSPTWKIKFLIFGRILTTVQTWTCIYFKKYNLEKSGNNQGKVREIHSVNLVDTMCSTYLMYIFIHHEDRKKHCFGGFESFKIFENTKETSFWLFGKNIWKKNLCFWAFFFNIIFKSRL